MIFSEYYDMWHKDGFKLTFGIEITKEVLGPGNKQNQVLYLIWEINEVNQTVIYHKLLSAVNRTTFV